MEKCECAKCGGILSKIAATPEPVQVEPPPAPREYPPLSSSDDFDYWCWRCGGWSHPLPPPELHITLDHDRDVASARISEPVRNPTLTIGEHVYQPILASLSMPCASMRISDARR